MAIDYWRTATRVIMTTTKLLDLEYSFCYTSSIGTILIFVELMRALVKFCVQKHLDYQRDLGSSLSANSGNSTSTCVLTKDTILLG